MYKISETLYWLVNRPLNFKSNCQRFSLKFHLISKKFFGKVLL